MSITIYDGMRATASDPFEVARQIRAVLEPVFHKKFKESYEKAKECVGTSWSQVFFTQEKQQIEKSTVDFNLYEIVNNLHKSAQHTFSDLDFGYDVLLYENAAGGNPLVLVFAENAREYRDLLIAAGVVEAYGYWDNSDEDENASVEEWEERKLAWSVLGDTNSGNTFLMIPHPDKIEACVRLYPKVR